MTGEEHVALAPFEAEDFEELRLWLDEPHVPDAGLRVDTHLASAIYGFRRWRDNLACPIGLEHEKGGVGHGGQPGNSPASHVGNDDVWSRPEVQLRFGNDPPPPRIVRATAVLLVERAEGHADSRRSPCMHRRRPGRDDELAVDNLRDLLRGDLEQLFVSGGTASHVI